MTVENAGPSQPDAAAREELIRQRLAGGRRSRRTGIQPVARTGRLPVSFGQQRLWFLNMLDPESPEYQIPLVLRLRGPVDPDALRRAWVGLLTRHEVLRTRYQLIDAEPMQIIDPPGAPNLPLTDLTGQPAADREQRALDLARHETELPFDLGLEHPIRGRLVRLAEKDHLLIVVLHHIAVDGWSTEILVRELLTLQIAESTGGTAALPALPIQYADFAAWQRARLTGDQLERHLAYWRTRLTGVSRLELPTDRPRQAVRDWAGDRVVDTFGAELADGLRKLASQFDTTLFTVGLTAFQVLLARYSGQRDIAVGSAMSGRNHPELRDLIGFFLNTVVLRADWSGDPSFARLLSDNRGHVLAALEHQDAPLQLLVDEHDRDRNRSRTPLFQVMFDVADAPPASFDLPGLAVTPVDVVGAVAKHDLRLELTEQPDGTLRAVLEYPTALFERDSARRLLEHYRCLLTSVLADPQQTVGALALFAAEEQAELRGFATGTVESYPWRPVSDAVAARAVETPDAPAVIAGPDRLSYAQLDARANQVARHLTGRGVGPGAVVGVCLGRGPDLLPALLGVWRAGAAYVPIDPADPPQRLAAVLDDAAAAVVITETEYADRVYRVGSQQILLDLDRAMIDAEADDAVGTAPQPADAAYLIYTSGSTGRPKGVLVTHGGLGNYLAWAAGRYLSPAGNGAPLFSSTAFDLVVTTLYLPLLAGQPVHVLPRDLDVAGDLAEALLDAASAGPFSFIKLTPGHLDLLTHQLTAAEANRLAGHLVVGGEGFASRLAAQWWQLAAGADTVLVNEYGPTENTVANIAHFMTGPQPDGAELLPIGRPMPNTTGHVLDAELRPVPPGAIGDLYLGGAQLARGYLGLPEVTAERFVPDPYGPPGARLYRTGDRARMLPGGDLEFIGRADEQIKIRGYRVETAEIVAALVRHPQIRDAVVVLRDSGSGSRTLVGYVVTADPAELRPDEVRAFLSGSLPDYMIPAAVVALDEIPLTSNGKTDFKALPDPDRSSRQADGAAVAPRTPMEERVAAVWQTVLGIGQVGVHDNFFDLGGDSLSAVALVGDLRDAGLDLTVQDVFEHPTVVGLAELVGERPEAVAARPAVAPYELISATDRAKLPDHVEDAFPTSMLQVGMVYEMLAGGAVNYYHNATTYVIRDNAPFSLPALQAAADLLVQRQEVLRTGFDVRTYGEPLQLIHRTAHLPVGVDDLRHLSATEQDEEVRRYMAAERDRLFDISQPPLLRVHAQQRTDTTWSLTITECHPIMEGWSYHLLLMELLTYYRQVRDGKPVDPPAQLGIRYADFIAAEREALTGGVDKAYWHRALDGVSRFTLPAGWADSQAGAKRPYMVQVMFADLDSDLRALAKTAEVPIKCVLHAAHLKVLSMLTDEPAFYNGLVCDTRPEVAGADRLYGLFLNTVPIPFRMTARTWRELVQDVFARETELWPHRRYPLPALQRELAGGRRLIEVMFNYLDFRSVDTELVDFEAGIDDSQIEFKLSATAFKQGVLNLRMHPDAISRENGERLGAIYRLVLKAMAADPDGDALATHLPAEELRRLLTDWNDTAVPAARPDTLTELFARRVREAPHALAVQTAEGNVISYRRLDERSNQLAHHLRALGVGPEQFVGLCIPHSFELLVGLLGIVKAGAAYLPLDPEHPVERLSYALRDSGAGVVVTIDELLDVLPQFFGQQVCLDSDRAEIESQPVSAPEPRIGPDNLVYAIYTSGSTGRPKGVMITHGGLANYLNWAAEEYCRPDGDGAPLLGSLAFDLPVTNLLVPLTTGRSVTLLPTGRQVEAVAELLAAPGRYDLLKLTPAHLDLLRGQLPAGTLVDSVRTFVVGGEQLPLETVNGWRQVAPDARVINEYGPTETVVGCSIHEVPAGLPAGAQIAIGKPIANTRMYVLDRYLQPVPVGVLGELYIGGAGVARGYHGRPELTAERFLPDPYGPPGSRLYRTGDVARYRADGELEFLDRADNQIKIRGYRIEPGEIEARLVAHRDVAEAVVIARTDPGTDKRLVGYLVAAPGQEIRVETIREYLRESLPDYLVPTALVVLDALPRSTAGKIDRKALPAPEGTRAGAETGYQAPRNATERRLAEIWQRVLGVAQIGVDDDLLDLGADSLSGLRVAAEATDLGLDMSPMDAVAYPTVAELARHLLGGDDSELLAEMVQDTELDPALRPSGDPLADPAGPVLLTGATGFVGPFLLRALLDGTDHRVICLVRGASDEEATKRLYATLQRSEVFDPELTDRIEVIAGDLAKPGFGLTPERFAELSGQISAIYHNGAMVSAVYPYRHMRPINVGGTREVIRMACTGPLKPVHHVSTMSVFSEHSGIGPIDEETFQSEPPYPANGYSQSKWVAEMLIREAGRRGVPTRIFRMGKISWDPTTGVYNPDDMMTRVIHGCLDLAMVPRLSYQMTLTPVNHVAASIVRAAGDPTTDGRSFHLVSRHQLSWDVLVEWIREAGHQVEWVDYRMWRNRAVARSEEPDGAHLKSLAMVLPRDGEEEEFDTEDGIPDDFVPPTPTWLDRAGAGCDPVVREDFLAFLRRLTETLESRTS